MIGPQLFTIGHSNHPLEQFVALLRMHGVTAVADVRSTPYSRRHPQFNKDRLDAAIGKVSSDVYAGKDIGCWLVDDIDVDI